MNIVQGSGNSRKVLVFPCSHFVHNSSKAEQKQAKNLLCDLLGIDPNSRPPKRERKAA